MYEWIKDGYVIIYTVNTKGTALVLACGSVAELESIRQKAEAGYQEFLVGTLETIKTRCYY